MDNPVNNTEVKAVCVKCGQQVFYIDEHDGGCPSDAPPTDKESLYLHGTITTTQGDIRDPSTWETTERHPPKKPLIDKD